MPRPAITDGNPRRMPRRESSWKSGSALGMNKNWRHNADGMEDENQREAHRRLALLGHLLGYPKGLTNYLSCRSVVAFGDGLGGFERHRRYA